MAGRERCSCSPSSTTAATGSIASTSRAATSRRSSTPRARSNGHRCGRTARSGTATRAAPRRSGSWTTPATEVLPLEGEPAPPGRPYRSFRFDNRHGDSVQGFIVTPEGEGPWPILIRPHGGPTWLDEDRWNPEVQSYVDAGFAVAAVNYRGSTGRGAEWRDALIGDIGGPELEDLNDALDHLVAEGIADPERAVVGGWSWGGYLTLMMLGKHPGAWLAMRDRRDPGRRLRALLRRHVAAPAGVRPRPARRPSRRGPRADGRPQPDQLRPTGSRRPCCS